LHSPKKQVFSIFRGHKKVSNFFYVEGILQLFSADTLQKLKKKEMTPKKLLTIGPQLFFSTGPAAQTAQKQKSRTAKSPLIQD
jgi:hypothetical protein